MNTSQSQVLSKATIEFEEQLDKCVNFWLCNAVDNQNG